MEKEDSLWATDRTEDSKRILKIPKISEDIIRKGLVKDGLVSRNKRNNTRPIAYDLPLKEHSKKPPRVLKKIDRTAKQNYSIQALAEKMEAADYLHKEKLLERGKSARTYEERYAKLRKARAQEEENKRKKIEEKHKRAEEILSKREKEIAASMFRISKNQEHCEIQQNKILQKYDQRRKRGKKRKNKLQKLKKTDLDSQNEIRQKLDAIEKQINPVELLLNASEQAAHPKSPKIDP